MALNVPLKASSWLGVIAPTVHQWESLTYVGWYGLDGTERPRAIDKAPGLRV